MTTFWRRLTGELSEKCKMFLLLRVKRAGLDAKPRGSPEAHRMGDVVGPNFSTTEDTGEHRRSHFHSHSSVLLRAPLCPLWFALRIPAQDQLVDFYRSHS